MTSNVKSAKILRYLAWFIILINIVILSFLLIALITLNKQDIYYNILRIFYIAALGISFVFSLIIPAVLFGIADIVNNTHTNNLLLAQKSDITIYTDDFDDEKKDSKKEVIQKKASINNCKSCVHDIDSKKCEVYDIKPKNVENYQDGYCHYYIKK